MLTGLGVEGDSALNGHHALELMEERVKACKEGSAEMYKTVLLDYSMP